MNPHYQKKKKMFLVLTMFYLCIDLVDLLANAKLNDDNDDLEEISQPNRGNKISKKNKKKNKNQQQNLEDDSAGIS